MIGFCLTLRLTIVTERLARPWLLCLGLLAGVFATPTRAQEPIIPVGFHAGMPTIASFSFGGGAQLPHHGILVLLAEPGIGGGRASVGYLRLRRGMSFIGRTTLLRTWGHPWEADPGHTFAGPELQAMFTGRLVGARAGVLFPLGESRRSIATLGVVFGV